MPSGAFSTIIFQRLSIDGAGAPAAIYKMEDAFSSPLRKLSRD
jgi:hypothetical protein